MISTNRKPRAFAPDPAAPGQGCDSPGCPREGGFRAPKSRANLREFRWFCLEHVREYNASWDYYKGMSEGEIEAEVRADASWQRPTWPLGQNSNTAKLQESLEAELRAFAFGAERPAPHTNAPPELREALEVFELVWPVSLDTVKTTYKALAKKHHPDANQGSKQAEERLKTINLAYATLRAKLA
jgi:hypothetical protein